MGKGARPHFAALPSLPPSSFLSVPYPILPYCSRVNSPPPSLSVVVLPISPSSLLPSLPPSSGREHPTNNNADEAKAAFGLIRLTHGPRELQRNDARARGMRGDNVSPRSPSQRLRMGTLIKRDSKLSSQNAAQNKCKHHSCLQSAISVISLVNFVFTNKLCPTYASQKYAVCAQNSPNMSQPLRSLLRSLLMLYSNDGR